MLGWLLNLGFAGGSVVVTPDVIVTFVAEIRQTEPLVADIEQTKLLVADIEQVKSLDAEIL